MSNGICGIWQLRISLFSLLSDWVFGILQWNVYYADTLGTTKCPGFPGLPQYVYENLGAQRNVRFVHTGIQIAKCPQKQVSLYSVIVLRWLGYYGGKFLMESSIQEKVTSGHLVPP